MRSVRSGSGDNMVVLINKRERVSSVVQDEDEMPIMKQGRLKK